MREGEDGREGEMCKYQCGEYCTGREGMHTSHAFSLKDDMVS